MLVVSDTRPPKLHVRLDDRLESLGFLIQFVRPTGEIADLGIERAGNGRPGLTARPFISMHFSRPWCAGT
jgi:hypothetical protein